MRLIHGCIIVFSSFKCSVSIVMQNCAQSNKTAPFAVHNKDLGQKVLAKSFIGLSKLFSQHVTLCGVIFISTDVFLFFNLLPH